jgi:tellurium resistance protein TerD
MVDRKSVHLDKSRAVRVGYGWDSYPSQRSFGLIGGLLELRKNRGIDCDGSAIFCGKDGRPISAGTGNSCLFYGNLSLFEGAAVHHGDNKSGIGPGDDEAVTLHLDRLPGEVWRIALTLDLFKEKKQFMSFGRVSQAFIRLSDEESGEELCRCSFQEGKSRDKALLGGWIFRDESGEWFYEPALHTRLKARSLEELLSLLGETAL